MEAEKRWMLHSRLCWLPEQRMHCPFVKLNVKKCEFFDCFLQRKEKDGKLYIERDKDCKKWSGELMITVMP